MKVLRSVTLTAVCITLLMTSGCFKAIVETREPLPDIIWPKPPEIPRIRFVNAITKPEDLNIRESLSKKFLNFFKGEENISIVKPYGVTTDSEGRLFVVDNFARQIIVFDEKNKTYYKFPNKETELVSPIDITLDKSGNIYVSDSKAAVVKVFNNSGKSYVTEIGTGVLGRPTGLSVNEKTNELLVVDTINSQIIRYNLDTLQFKGKIGREGSAAGSFHYPTNISVNRDGNIFVTDSLNFRIQVFNSAGEFLNVFGKPGDSPGYFSRPRGVAVDSDGNIYVVDAIFDNVQIFNSNGELLMDFGGPGNGYGQFWLPSGIFIDNNDNIYIADSFNNRIQVFKYFKGETLNP